MFKARIDLRFSDVSTVFQSKLRAQAAAFRRMPLAGTVALSALLIGALGWTQAYLEDSSLRTQAESAYVEISSYQNRGAALVAYETDGEPVEAGPLEGACPEIIRLCGS